MMVKPQQFDIILGSPRAVYKAGSVVTGSLILHTEQPQLYTSLGLKFSGKGRVNFTKGAGGGRGGKQRYTNKECYFKRDVRLLPRGFGSMANETMEQGHHEFPFTFNLPANVPSSYECPSGSVRYCVKAKLELGWADSLSVRKYFVVFKPLDLNDHNQARCSEEQEVERPICCLPCTTNNMAVRVSIPKRGYVPGESIHVQWEMRNVWIRKIYFTIEEVSFCRASDVTVEASETLKTHVPVGQEPADGESNASSSNMARFGQETITVPVAVPSGLDNCRIIDLEHRLVLHVVSLSPACSVDIPLNIMIGTTPLASTRYDEDDTQQQGDAVEEEEEEPPPDYDSGYSISQDSLPRRSSVSSSQGIMGVQPPAYSPSPIADSEAQARETPM
ncbi:arrestin domain-containing protein 3-like isoform X2 [Babylonia areolata]|uniref:arrestin domain-containing protein 3-like isoform X2 n=1 Tax=Babylonia areolata TaxID=304850 RepID=UPI003FD128BA